MFTPATVEETATMTTVGRIVTMLSFGLSLDEVRAEIRPESEGDFFLAVKAAELLIRWG